MSQHPLHAAANDEPMAVLRTADEAAVSSEVLRENMADAMTPGYQVEFDPEEAERAGAFREDALSEEDAAASSDELAEVDGDMEPAFMDDDGPSLDIPPFICITNSRELFDPRPGETVAQAAARKASEVCSPGGGTAPTGPTR